MIPNPKLIHNERIFRVVEDRTTPEEWGDNFRSLFLSAPVNADLMKAGNWTTSKRLRYNQDWPCRAWLEGNILVTADGQIINILWNDLRPEGGRPCIIDVSKYGNEVCFNLETGFIDFPGGCKKFDIRYNAVSGRYWSLSNYIPDDYRRGGAERIWNAFGLIFSKDLSNWEGYKIVLQHSDVTYVGSQYAGQRFDGEDMIALIRIAYPELDGTNAKNYPNSNYIIFFRIEKFKDFQTDIHK